MRRFIPGFLLIVMLLLSSADASETCLWEVRSSSTKMYVLGSIHILKQEHYPLKKQIDDAYEQAEKILFEIDMDSSQSLTVQTMIMSQGMIKGEETLQSKLPDSVYQQAAKACEEFGLDITFWEKFEPWYFSMMIMVMRLMQLGYDPTYGVDMHFYKKAQEDGKEIAGLETIAFQLSLFEKIPPEKIIQQTLSDLDIIEKEFAKIFQAWSNGESEQLESLTIQQLKSYPELYENLIKKRNENWFVKMRKLLSETDVCMIIVGAGHLVGEDGLVEMLKRAGYMIRQM